MRDLLNDSEHRYAAVGFIDDDQTKVGNAIHGVPIFSSTKLPELIERYNVKDVLISTTKIPQAKVTHLEGLGVFLGRLHVRIESDAA